MSANAISSETILAGHQCVEAMAEAQQASAAAIRVCSAPTVAQPLWQAVPAYVDSDSGHLIGTGHN